MGWLKAALGAAAAAFVKDAVDRPRQLGSAARAYCDRVGKPLLLVSTPSMLGDPVRAEVTMRRAAHVPVADKSFGAVLAIGILERQERPDLVLAEWRRIADTVFVVVPPWWSPMTWLNPNHRWYIDPTLKRAAPIWTDRRHVYLLRVSDKSYGTRPWSPTRTSHPRPSPRTPSAPVAPDTASIPVPDFRSPGSSPSLSPSLSLSPLPDGSPPSAGDLSPPFSMTHLVTVEGDLPDYDEETPLFGS